MIKRIYPAMGTMFVYAVLLSICASMTMGQVGAKAFARAERDRLDKIMVQSSDIEAFRQEYLNYFTEIQDNMRLFISVPAVKQKLVDAGLKPIESLESAKATVSEMSQQDLTILRSTYAKFPGWRQMPDSMMSSDLREELTANLYAKKGQAISTSNVADDCSSGAHTATDISIARGVEYAAEGVMEALPTDGITIAARLAPVIAFTAARVATLAIETLKTIKDDCRDDIFQDDITTKVTAIPGLISTSTSTTATNITTAKTAIIDNDNTNKTTIVNNDNANKTTIVNNDNANTLTILTAVEKAKTYIVTDAAANRDEMKNLLLRTQIEADLASTDGSTFVALYETPSDLCKTSLNSLGIAQTVSLPGLPTVTIFQCGLLDLVRAIVKQTIANVGAGTGAQAFFNTAETQKAAGKYKAAYASYRQAYKAASK
jgi:hypothetical protein